jgi:rRNA maturation endonuclease Nob1
MAGQRTEWVESLSAVWVPHWVVVLLTAILPVMRLYRLVQREGWRQSGRCEGCGYDLRGSQEQCPECGRVITRTSAKLSEGETPPG